MYATNAIMRDNLPEGIPDIKLLTWCYATLLPPVIFWLRCQPAGGIPPSANS